MLERRELGDAGLTYVRERLLGGKTLSSLLLDRMEISGGRAWAYLPPAMTDAQAHHFEWAGVASTATGIDDEWIERSDGRWQVVRNPVHPLVVNHVQRFLSEKDQGVAVWEEPTAAAGDPWVKNHPEEPLFFLGDEVYYVLQHHTATLGAVGDGLERMVAWWGSPAVLSELPVEALRPFLTSRATLVPAQLQLLVEPLRLPFFTAYDGEGYVFWSPPESRFP